MKNPKLQLSSIIPKVCEAARLASMRTSNTLRSPSFPPEPLERCGSSCASTLQHPGPTTLLRSLTCDVLKKRQRATALQGYTACLQTVQEHAPPCVICGCADIQLETMWIFRALLTHGCGVGLCQQKHRRSRPRQIQAQPRTCHPRICRNLGRSGGPASALGRPALPCLRAAWTQLSCQAPTTKTSCGSRSPRGTRSPLHLS